MGESVLLIGKDSTFMEALSQHIGARNLTVHFAHNGPEALGILRHDDIDVVVININDLGADGIRIVDSIKQTKTRAEFITLTSPTTIHWSIEGMKRGAFADLLIPFDIEDLFTRLQEAGARRKAKKNKRRRKTSLRKRLEDLMVSATFAESRNFDTARQIMQESHTGKSDLE